MLTEVTDTEDVNKIDPIFTIELEKDKQGRIGIGIGGGSSSNCPCLYIVQIFENSPASRDKILEIGKCRYNLDRNIKSMSRR
jgi:hypothetical protein